MIASPLYLLHVNSRTTYPVFPNTYFGRTPRIDAKPPIPGSSDPTFSDLAIPSVYDGISRKQLLVTELTSTTITVKVPESIKNATGLKIPTSKGNNAYDIIILSAGTTHTISLNSVLRFDHYNDNTPSGPPTLEYTLVTSPTPLPGHAIAVLYNIPPAPQKRGEKAG